MIADLSNSEFEVLRTHILRQLGSVALQVHNSSCVLFLYTSSTLIGWLRASVVMIVIDEDLVK